jgi:hypothetical protein
MPGMNPYTPQMALVCLPPMMIPQQPRYPSKIRSKAFQSRHSYQPNNQVANCIFIMAKWKY